MKPCHGSDRRILRHRLAQPEACSQLILWHALAPPPPRPLAVRLWQGAQEHHSAQPATCCGRVTCGRVTCGHVIWRSAGPPGVAVCCVARTSQTLNNAPHPTPCQSPSLQPTRINPHGTGPVTRPGDLGQQPLHVLWQPRAAAQRPVVSEAPPTPGASERLPICRPRLLQCLAPRLLDQEPSTATMTGAAPSDSARAGRCFRRASRQALAAFSASSALVLVQAVVELVRSSPPPHRIGHLSLGTIAVYKVRCRRPLPGGKPGCRKPPPPIA